MITVCWFSFRFVAYWTVQPDCVCLPCAGVDVSTGVVPSKMTMFRLLMKEEIRQSAMKMAATLQEAGVDLQSKVRRS